MDANEFQIDLNFESKTIDTITIDKVKNFIENIEKYDKLNKTYILDDYNDEDGDTVKYYLEHHLEEVEKEELSNLINFDDVATEPELQLLQKLKLVRVGLYPGNEDNFAIFDYSIGEEITNYLVVINTDENGNLDYITMESWKNLIHIRFYNSGMKLQSSMVFLLLKICASIATPLQISKRLCH